MLGGSEASEAPRFAALVGLLSFAFSRVVANSSAAAPTDLVDPAACAGASRAIADALEWSRRRVGADIRIVEGLPQPYDFGERAAKLPFCGAPSRVFWPPAGLRPGAPARQRIYPV